MLAQNPRKVNLMYYAKHMGSGTANHYIPIAALNNTSMPTKLMRFMISITGKRITSGGANSCFFIIHIYKIDRMIVDMYGINKHLKKRTNIHIGLNAYITGIYSSV